MNIVLMVVAKPPGKAGKYSAAVINTGEGSEYHPSLAMAPDAEMRQVSMS